MSLESLPPEQRERLLAPRATLVAAAGRIAGLKSEIWMGGAHSTTGTPLEGDWLANAWVIDLAGDTHPDALIKVKRREAFVFPDMEHRPDRIDRLFLLADEFAAAARADHGPARIVSLCQHGMNRSGLATGLLLRALGTSYEDTVSMIRQARPGALANHAFEAILAEERYSSSL